MNLNNLPDGLHEDAPLLNGIRKENPFTAPPGYAEQLEEQITSRIFLESFAENKVSETFAVPEAYFEQLERRIVSRTGIKKPARIIRFNTIAKFAAAASVILIISAAIFFNQQPAAPELVLTDISDQEIVSYLQVHSDAADTELILENLDPETDLSSLGPDVTDNDIKTYLDDTLF